MLSTKGTGNFNFFNNSTIYFLSIAESAIALRYSTYYLLHPHFVRPSRYGIRLEVGNSGQRSIIIYRRG